MNFLEKINMLDESRRVQYVIDTGIFYNLQINSATINYKFPNCDSIDLIFKGIRLDLHLKKLFDLLNIVIKKKNSKCILIENNKQFECPLLICLLENKEGAMVKHTILNIENLTEILA
ncbi:TPA: hypothetical protein KQG29_001571 [Clostridioides difficile]|nr:hypothetical protein [Clostridioides difficile]